MSDYIQTGIQGHNYYLTVNHKRARYHMRKLAHRLVGQIMQNGVLTDAHRVDALFYVSQHIYEADLNTPVRREDCIIERSTLGPLKSLTMKVLFDKHGAVDLDHEHIQLDMYFGHKSKYVQAVIENQIMDPNTECSGSCSQSFKIHYKDIQ